MKQEMSKTRKKYNRKWVQHESKSWKKHRKNAAKKNVQQEENATWKEFKMKECNVEKLQHGMSTTQKSASWSECNINQNETRCNMKKVQDEKSATRRKVKHE